MFYTNQIANLFFNVILSLTSCRKFRGYDLSAFVLGSLSRINETIEQ